MTVSSLNYEKARPTDLPALLDLLRAADLPTADLDSESWRGFHIARQGNTVVGGIALERIDNACLLRSMVVAPHVRDRGIGRELLRLALEEARRQEFTELHLLTTTAESFFERSGFERIERSTAPTAVRQSREFRELCPDSAVVMRLAL